MSILLGRCPWRAHYANWASVLSLRAGLWWSRNRPPCLALQLPSMVCMSRWAYFFLLGVKALASSGYIQLAVFWLCCQWPVVSGIDWLSWIFSFNLSLVGEEKGKIFPSDVASSMAVEQCIRGRCFALRKPTTWQLISPLLGPKQSVWIRFILVALDLPQLWCWSLSFGCVTKSYDAWIALSGLFIQVVS